MIGALRSVLAVRLRAVDMRGLTILSMFVTVQVLDALLTWIGIGRFGAGVEANPVLSFYAAIFGAGATLGVAKSVAVGGGFVLYLRSHYVVLALLTFVHVCGALVPWLWLLFT